jgi:hypothetical protein
MDLPNANPREVQLKLLVIETQFEYAGGMYEKGGCTRGVEVMCHPILGGQVQSGIEDWITETATVLVR